MALDKKLTRRAAQFSLVLFLAACSGNDDMGTGKLDLAIADAAVDNAKAVVVEFTGVELQPSNGQRIEFDFDTPRQIDLLALSGGASDPVLHGVTVPAGHYEWLRLKVNATADNVMDSYITLDDDTQHELTIPSGAETGLKLHNGFNVPAGRTADFTVDFDLRKSVHLPMSPGGAYVLRPTLRIVETPDSGLIAGTVDASLITSGCTPAVYVFAGSDVTPDDVDGIAADPVTTAIVQSDGHYAAAFLPPGDYTAAFTCEAGADDPSSDDAIAFGAAKNATVAAGDTTTVDFP